MAINTNGGKEHKHANSKKVFLNIQKMLKINGYADSLYVTEESPIYEALMGEAGEEVTIKLTIKPQSYDPAETKAVESMAADDLFA